MTPPATNTHDDDDLVCACGHPGDVHDVPLGPFGAMCQIAGCPCDRYMSACADDDDE